jgi:Flp pilus assembly pilin Flp
MKRLVNCFMVGGFSATVIEYGLIMVLVGLACITAWMHVSASLNIPSVSASTSPTRPCRLRPPGRFAVDGCIVRHARGRLRRSEKPHYGPAELSCQVYGMRCATR